MGFPSVSDVRAWCQISAASLTDVQLKQVVDAEQANQAMYCRVPTTGDPPALDPDAWPAALSQAIYRRVAREVAGRGIPLGLIADLASESGAQRLSTFDAEVERLEGPYRIVVFG